MDDYFVRIGRPRERAIETYDQLFGLSYEAEECEDDGLIVYSVPRDQDTAWNEGRCPCGGIMRWAEAGTVSWYRICDLCGSAYSLHPVLTTLDGSGQLRTSVLHDEESDRKPRVQEALARVRASLAKQPATEEERQHGGIYASWAERARHYRG